MQMFKNSLSIRHYSLELKQHSHSHHQLVFPLQGTLNINMQGHLGFVDVGQCLIIKAYEKHGFTAHENARFIVADMHTLPSKLMDNQHCVFFISKPLLAHLDFVDKQLSFQVNTEIETLSQSLFESLLGQQDCFEILDKRIEKVIHHLNDELAQSHTLIQLSQLACLSVTQFKKVFKTNTQMTVQGYLTHIRMHKAKSLLAHSDLPIQIIGEMVGYHNPSAFSRKFKQYFGQSPKDRSRIK